MQFFRYCLYLFIALTGFNSPSFLPPALAAPTDGLACVQNQMAALDIDIGAIDGVFGKQTAAGSKRVIEQIPALEGLLKLDSYNALAWCREIALQKPDLKQFWPTQQADHFEYIFSGTLTEVQKEAIQKGMDFAIDFFKQQSIELPGRVKIIASDNMSELASSLSKNAREYYPLNQALKTIENQCDGTDLSGLNLSGLIVICLSSDVDLQKNRNKLIDLSIHEYAHETQRQMTSYSKKSAKTAQDIVDQDGPRWLVEALAVTIGAKGTYTRLDPKRYVDFLVRDIPNYSRYELRLMDKKEAVELPQFGTYIGLAGQLLAQKKGIEGIFDFWRQMAREDWRSAFQSAFGLSLEAFYIEFNETAFPKIEVASLIKDGLRPYIQTQGDDGIACVQQQLTAMDINTGIIDGLYGRKTFRGSRKLIKTLPMLMALDDLTRDNGLVWCRQIGYLDPALRLYWPVQNRSFDVMFQQEISAKNRQIITRSLNRVHTSFEKLGFEPTGRVNILVGSQQANLITISQKHVRYESDINQIDNELNAQCSPQRSGTQLVSVDGLVILCLDGNDAELDARVIEDLLMAALAQEYIKQVSGYGRENMPTGDQFFQVGPRWLYEGIALALVDIHRDPDMDVTDHSTPQKEDYELLMQLPKLEAYSGKPPIKQRKLGVLAAHLLAVKTGTYQSYFKYWQELSTSKWESAFAIAFGQSVEQFYDSLK
jgi:hypothetical protein